jgi:exonuclease III
MDLHRRLRPDVFFLSETHLTKARAVTIKKKLGYDHMIESESDGRSGGLLMLWKKELNVTSFSVHTNYLDIRIDENTANAWRITGFYGEPSGERKHLSWDYLRDLHGMYALPWLVIGDFNEILSNSEKEGGNLRPQRCMQQFRDALTHCNLTDLGFLGDAFTWRRGRIRERLDRAVANQDWRDLFPLAGVINEDFWKSDHRPITVDSEHFDVAQIRAGGGKRMFEAKWLIEESFDDIVWRA